ncbi:heme/hemin ABC transporter substrate-binding protein [Ruicaihuangia caeni]|uniref:ABC transporter substrate-binding protein n=1 Tax=Ruicaihuangia caeni TaxID=3042517 RepID=A0AAW6T7R6_9MICO|nr:ABC transporter substrate-binding protein [Klugiella sp. YN-L-19]MDI2098756.1 ABC transporter substrate-binding protein [Klugiella sp. YN-L-19]
MITPERTGERRPRARHKGAVAASVAVRNLRGRRVRRLAAVGVVAALLTGCTSPSTGAQNGASTGGVAPRVPLSELQVLDDPRAYEGGSTAVLADADIEPIDPAPEQQLPVRVVSHDLAGDVEVTVTSTDRIIGFDMAGSINATLAGLGFADRLVGRDISSTFPEVEELPIVTSSAHTINIEAVLSLRPTLVITDGSIGPIDVVLQLRDAGVPVVFVERDPSIEGILELARQVAAAVGAPAAGEALAQQLSQQIDAKIAEIAEIAPDADEQKLRVVFLYLRGTSGIYYLFGDESGADVLITSLGARDVAAEIGWDGMKPVTDEAMVAANPDLVLVMTHGLESVGGIDGLLEDRPALALTNAGQHRRFVDMADGDILGFGPRFPDVLDALARAFYAPEG